MAKLLHMIGRQAALVTIIVSIAVSLATTPQAQAQTQASGNLNCRILSNDSQEGLQFAAAAAAWSDEEASGMSALEGGERVYKCSRELRAAVCQTFAGAIIDGDAMKSNALTGAFLTSMGDGGLIDGALLGVGYTMLSSITGKTVAMGQCLQSLELSTSIADRISLDWGGTFSNASELSYPNYLMIVDAALSEELVNQDEANNLMTFTDKLLVLVGG